MLRSSHGNWKKRCETRVGMEQNCVGLVGTIEEEEEEAVDNKGLHSLSCKVVASRSARHRGLNDVIWRALSAANIPVAKKPSGVVRSEVKRPDSLTLIPWKLSLIHI